TRHGNLPWVVIGKQPPLSEDVWELYDTTKDWSQAHDLAKQMPEKVAELKRLFDIEAPKHNVFPPDDRKGERVHPASAGRPNGAKVGEGRVARTHAYLFSMDETMDIGCDVGEPVSEDYGAKGNAFNGKIGWVQIDIDAAAKDADHRIGAEERYRLAMARQ